MAVTLIMADGGFKNVVTAFSNRFAALHEIYHITSRALIVTLARNGSSYKIAAESHQSAFFLHLRENVRCIDVKVKARKYSLKEQFVQFISSDYNYTHSTAIKLIFNNSKVLDEEVCYILKI